MASTTKLTSSKPSSMRRTYHVARAPSKLSVGSIATSRASHKRVGRTPSLRESFPVGVFALSRPIGARVSGNLQPHPLHSYPVSPRAEAAMRGLSISSFTSAISIEVGFCFVMAKSCHEDKLCLVLSWLARTFAANERRLPVL
jgi:hypothetical protein